jgi:hypothetical protein
VARRPRAAGDNDGDLSIEPRVARAIDLGHAARANQGDDLIRPEAVPDGRGIKRPAGGGRASLPSESDVVAD